MVVADDSTVAFVDNESVPSAVGSNAAKAVELRGLVRATCDPPARESFPCCPPCDWWAARESTTVRTRRVGLMALPRKLKQKYLDRLDELILRGEQIEIQRGSKAVQTGVSGGYGRFGRQPTYREVPTVKVDYDSFRPWRASCVTLLERILPKTDAHSKWLETANSLRESASDLIPWLIARLRAVREDFELGFFDDLGDQIESEIASNYMGQAEVLLGECQAATYAYVPAAVLAGAVLERHLRELCTKQSPSINTCNPNGKPKTLDPLISDLARAGVLTAPQAALLRGFAAVRNKAAHGEWDSFTRADVENMVQGVKNVLAYPTST